MRDLWMWGITPPPAMVALIRVSSSSSPRMASWRWRGVMRLTCGFPDRAGGGVGQSASSSWFFVARKKRTEKTFFERIQNASRRSVDLTRPRPRTETCR